MAELTADRRNQIAQILLREGSIKATEMAELFHVSTETIRKDIIYLEEAGIAEKNHGGAIAKVNAVEKTLSEKDFLNKDEKAEIAMKAMDLIPQNATILLDAGSTTNAIARQLTMRKGLTIFTNSVNLVNILAESDNDIYLMGGKIRHSSKATVGGWTLEVLASLHADLAFLGSDGFKNAAGPTSMSYEEMNLKQLGVKCSDRTYVVADSSKILSEDRFSYARWEEVTGIVTAGKFTDRVREFLKDKTEVL